MNGVLAGVAVTWLVVMAAVSARALRRGWALSAPQALDSVLGVVSDVREVPTRTPPVEQSTGQATNEAVETVLAADLMAGRISTATYRRALEHLAAPDRVAARRA